MLAGLEGAEDAGVYRVSDDMALVQTLDFFTPIVDDPYDFGQIAAANALSDVYAMGATPLTAMNIVCFPLATMSLSVLEAVLAGGLDKVKEAGVALVGGHSIEDKELKYGLSVTGLVHPERIVRNTGARLGDSVILTKPLGTGIISTALKHGAAPGSAVEAITRSMTALNRVASESMRHWEVHACTDVTGFGLLGHACEMIDRASVGLTLWSSAVPRFPEAEQLAQRGFMPGGLHRNRLYRQHMVAIEGSVPEYVADLLYDPQTCGGLLVSVPQRESRGLLDELHEAGLVETAVIGEVTAEPRGKALVL